MVFCPNCGMENADSARFCKKCGNPLMGNSPIKEDYVSTGRDPTERPVMPSSNSNKSNGSGDNKNLIIICLTVVICAILIAGGLVLMSNNHNDTNDNLDSSVSLANNSVNQTDVVEDNTASKIEILSGSFSTGSSKSDKTYCSVYVGEQYAGENVKISVLYSRDGSTLNQGNIVPKTVDSSGYVSVPSANAFKYYPDDAYITLYDSDGNVLDTQEVYLSPQSGKQTF